MSDAWTVAAAAAATALVLAVAPIEELGFVLQFFGARTAVGTLVAYRATRRDPSRETLPIQVRWGSVGLFLAVGAVLIDGLT